MNGPDKYLKRSQRV